MTIHALEVTTGLAAGMTVQFAEGRWPGEIGAGVLMSDEAFGLIEPFVASVCADWTSDHRYGVFELSLQDRRALAATLGEAATTHHSPKLLLELAYWLEARSQVNQPISILGY